MKTSGSDSAIRADETSNALPYDRVVPRNGPIRMLRLAQVIDATGLGKTKIYEFQAEGNFPMRVKITAHSVAWIEEEVQAWLAARVQANTAPNTAFKTYRSEAQSRRLRVSPYVNRPPRRYRRPAE